MRTLLILSTLATSLAAQAVLPPFDASLQAVQLGSIPGVFSYGGTAFSPNDADVLLVSPYASGEVRAVTLTRAANGDIIGIAGTAPYATVGGTDGGLAFGPGGVLFGTWYGAHRLYQLEPGSSTPDREDDLGAIGVPYSVGACTFVPAGLPGAGAFKVLSWNSSELCTVPLTPDGSGTYTPGGASATIQLSGGPEGLVYAPASLPLVGGRLLVAEYSDGVVSAYQLDANSDPIPATRQVVIGGIPGAGGGAVDPVTGDVVFTDYTGRLVVLRDGPTCGSIISYGAASSGPSGTPTLTASGCARIGQTLQLGLGGAPGAFGLLALGYSQLAFDWNGLQILQSLDVTVVSVLDGTGQATLPLPIPLQPLLGNQHVYLQAAFLDAGTASGFVGTAGVDVTIR
ncbi:MAG: hypothetical protein R3F29_09265 [Planctomycetota bacterium]